MVLSGFESNDDDNLAALRKKSSWQKNLRANEVMRENGIFSTGVFMIRADWTHEQFELLYDYVRSLQIAMPLFTILTPLPGTQLYRAYKDKLLTTDHRLFDLLHAVLPTRLPSREFYREFARSYDANRGVGAQRLQLDHEEAAALRREGAAQHGVVLRAHVAVSADPPGLSVVPARRGRAHERARREGGAHVEGHRVPEGG